MPPSDHIDSYYSRTRSDVRARAALRGRVETDTCVIGGGLAGIATALGLAERGHSVVVLEANRLGWGASGRNGGFLSAGFALGAQELEARIGLDSAQELYEMSSDAVDLIRQRAEIYGIDCGGFPAGGVKNSWFADTNSVKAGIGYMNQRFGTNLEYWSREEGARDLSEPTVPRRGVQSTRLSTAFHELCQWMRDRSRRDGCNLL